MSKAYQANKKSKNTILKYLKKTDQDLEESVQIIKNWYAQQPHLPKTPSQSTFEFFVINNRFNLESTKEKLDSYYTMRTTLNVVFDHSNPHSLEMQRTIEATQVLPLPRLVDNLYGVMFVKVRDFVPVDFDAQYWISAMVNVHEVEMQENCLLNYSIVYDHEHLGFNHVLKVTPVFIVNAHKMSQRGLGDRILALHFINCPSVFAGIIKLMKTLLPKELIDRIFLHSSVDSLAEHIPMDLLPSDYGGQERSLSELEEEWLKKYNEYKEYFDELDKMKVNEALRPPSDAEEEPSGFRPFSNLRNFFQR